MMKKDKNSALFPANLYPEEDVSLHTIITYLDAYQKF